MNEPSQLCQFFHDKGSKHKHKWRFMGRRGNTNDVDWCTRCGMIRITYKTLSLAVLRYTYYKPSGE